LGICLWTKKRYSLSADVKQNLNLLLTLLFSCSLWRMGQNFALAYDATLAGPLILIMCLLAIQILRGMFAGTGWLNRGNWIVVVILMLTFVSHVYLIANLVPYALGPWRTQAYLREQPYSFGIFQAKTVREEFNKAHGRCIPPEKPWGPFFMVAELGYLLNKSEIKGPIFATFIDQKTFPIDDMRSWIRKFGVVGGVSECWRLPAAIRGQQVTPNLCCVIIAEAEQKVGP
jgi:hypothetical protein